MPTSPIRRPVTQLTTRMIAAATLILIQEWFAAGHAIDAIAARAGCSAQTVRTVLNGKHPLQRRQPPRPRPRGTIRVAPTRCPTCRGTVTELPCRLCTIRDLKRSFAA